MAYLTLNDYKTYIQGNYLTQLVQSDQNKRVIEENASIQVIAERLKQRYDLNVEFTDTLPYSRAKTYGAGSRVTVDLGTGGFTAWVTLGGYSAGALVIYNSVGYRCTTANNDATFISANWANIAPQYTIFYAAYPSTCTLNGVTNPATLMNPYQPVFNYKNVYSSGDIVFWRGYTYVCAQATLLPAQQAALQYVSQSQQPPLNIFPDDPVGNKDGVYWKTKTAYVVAVDTPLTNAAWIQGDNRNQTIKDMMVCFTVFKLSPLLAPQNRPVNWKDDFVGLRGDLKSIARGEMNISLPYLQPAKGRRTVGGGEVKRINNW